MNDHCNPAIRLGTICFVFGILFFGYLLTIFDTASGQNITQIVLPTITHVMNSSTISVPTINYEISNEFNVISNNFSSDTESNKIAVSDVYVDPFISNSTLFKGSLIVQGQSNEPIENHTILNPTFSN